MILLFLKVCLLIFGYNASLFITPDSHERNKINDLIKSKGMKNIMIPVTPNLPPRYFTEFTIYFTTLDTKQPPWYSIPPNLDTYSIGRGKTWYSWHNGKCIEIYLDFCVPIFLPNSFFPCALFNYNSTAYLMSNPIFGYGSCCVFRKPWSPPHIDFMKGFVNNYTGTHDFLNKTLDWWEIPSENPTENSIPFGGYGWRADINEDNYREPRVFWFSGNVGWAQQIFYNFTNKGPEVEWIDNDFTLPPECHYAKKCKN